LIPDGLIGKRNLKKFHDMAVETKKQVHLYKHGLYINLQ